MMKTRTNRYPGSLGLLLLLVTLACQITGAPSPTPSPAEASPTSPPVATSTIPPTNTPQPSNTPPPPTVLSTPSSSCTPKADFVSDVTVPDGQVFSPGASFVKTWRVRNSGSCAWPAGTGLVFISADQMSGPSAIAAPAIEAGAEADLSVNLVAPLVAGTYGGNWQLQSPDGFLFGPILTVKIGVAAPATATAAPSPEATASPGACIAVEPVLKPVYDHIQAMGYDVGCPIRPAQSVQGAFQEFWANVEDVDPHTHYRSLMIWRSDTREVYVLDGNDTDCSTAMLLDYNDTWEVGQPIVYPDCQSMTVPQGYLMPVRGFGKVWCYNQLKGPVGWPAQPEVSVTLLIQPTQSGMLLFVPVQPSWGYLVALDYRAVGGVTMRVSR